MYFLFNVSVLLVCALPLSNASPTVQAVAAAPVPLAQRPLRSLDSAPVLHFTLARRDGAINATEYLQDYVNLEYLAKEIERTESRFNLTKREVKGNKLVRKAKVKDDGLLMGDVAGSGIW